MISNGRLLRFLRLAVAALQVALPTAAVVADAILEAEGARAYAHLEPHSSKSCPRAHSTELCDLCQFGRNHASGPEHPPVELWQRDCAPAALPQPAAFESRFSARSPLPRAPPALS
ncbi:MAG TPA: hypothetical protein VF771_03515 [Longimicrobiaceae bacterium]